MDTLEYRTEINQETGSCTFTPPVLWRGKTPLEVSREQYPDRNFLKRRDTPPKSTRVGIEYCESYDCNPHHESKAKYRVYGTLIALPEKK